MRCSGSSASARTCTFLGSYPRADKIPIEVTQRYDDEAFIDARDWLRGLIAGE